MTKRLQSADNSNLGLTDKMAKVKPQKHSKMLSKKVCHYGCLNQKLFIDESMVKYFGSHSEQLFQTIY